MSQYKKGGKITVRVYGLLIHEDKILVSDEYIKKNKITKYPGGGLQFGEGTVDALKREFMEELNQPVNIVEHYYTTDFFVSSAFHVRTQVISIYYLLKPLGTIMFRTSSVPHDYILKEGAQSFRWIDMNEIHEDMFSLIIDRKVTDHLAEDWNSGKIPEKYFPVNK